MAATKRHVNWSSVAFASATFTGVQSVEFDHRGEVISHSGDNEKFMTVKFLAGEDPQVTVTHRDITTANGKAVGTRGTLTARHNDADGTSYYTMTLSNAILANKSGGGQHRQFGEGRLVFEAESADGTTNPLGFA